MSAVSGEQVTHPIQQNVAVSPQDEQARPLPKMDRRQVELHDWLRRAAPSLAAPYLAAVTMMNDEGFPARAHLVCHVARDIYSTLPAILAGYKRSDTNEVIQAVDNLIQLWRSPCDIGGFADEVAYPPSRSEVAVPLETFRLVNAVIEARRRTKPAESSDEALVRHLYEAYAFAGESPRSHVVERFKQQRQWFTKSAHLNRDVPSSTDLGVQFAAFEDMIHSFVAPHFSVQEDLDEIIQQANQ